MGRYSDYGHADIGVGIFSVSGGPALLGDVYKLALTANVGTVGGMTLDLRFGPQGRQYDSDLSIASELVKAEIDGIGISLASVQFGGETVSLLIGITRFTYTRSQLDTLLVEQIVSAVGKEEARVGAEMAAAVIGAGMDAFDSIGQALTVNSITMAPRAGFGAHFVEANGFYAGYGATVATSGEDFLVILSSTSTKNTYEYFHREPDPHHSASEIQSYVEEHPDLSPSFIIMEIFGYSNEDEDIGIEYVINGLQEEVQDSFDNSFNFGPGVDDGIVDGTDSADIIDIFYTDIDGTSISEGDDIVQAGLGDDVVYGGGGNDRLDGGGGNDILTGGSGNDILIGGAGVDTADYSAALGAVNAYLTMGSVSGASGDDTLASIENLIGSEFNDRLIGNAETNVLKGGGGNDILKTKGGDDTVYGGAGDDKIVGDIGNETLYGGDGADIITGLGGTDTLYGEGGDDFLFGGRGADIVFGGAGNDRVRGNRGADTLNGDGGVDYLFGGGGNDILNGGADNDYLLGENGDDTLWGGAGNDSLTGGGGVDVFVYAAANDGYDRVKDFENGIDTIDLSGLGFSSFTDISSLASEIASGVKINFGGGNVLLLEGMVLADFDVADVII